MNISKARNALIDATVKVITKAKAKPPTIGQRIDAMIAHPNINDEERKDLVDMFEAALDNA